MSAVVLVAPVSDDPELRQRLELAAVPGVELKVLAGEKLAASGVCAGAEILLKTNGGDPLLFAQRKTLFVAFDTKGPVRRWPYFNYLLSSCSSAAPTSPRPSTSPSTGCASPKRRSPTCSLTSGGPSSNA